MDEDHAQTLWLENLKSANHYNRWIFSQILPYLGHDILEVGCGTGNFTELLAQPGLQVTAVDLNASYVQATAARLAGKPGVKVLLADATQLEGQRFFPQSFDTVVLLDVLEHIEQDAAMLHQLHSLIQPGGRLILKVPALTCLYSPLDEAIGHYRRYTKPTLLATLHQTAFVDPHVWYFNAIGTVGWWLNGKVFQRTIPPTNQVGLFNQCVPLLQAIEARVNLPFGLSLFAIATKA